MLNKFVIFIFILSSQVMADNTTVEKKNFETLQIKNADLLQETNSLKLETEASVQTQALRSDLFFNLLGGVTRPRFLSMVNGSRVVNYNFADFNALNLLTAQFTYYPFIEKWGKLGLAASLGYSYSDYRQTQATALHVLPVEIDVTYRADFKSTQKIIPYMMFGPQGWAVFQRGADQYNNSQLYRTWAASAGLAFNLTRLGIYNSRNEAEIIFQFKKTFANVTDVSDFNSNTYQLGGALSL